MPSTLPRRLFVAGAALTALIFLGWIIVTRLHVIYDSTVCWTSCG